MSEYGRHVDTDDSHGLSGGRPGAAPSARPPLDAPAAADPRRDRRRRGPRDRFEFVDRRRLWTPRPVDRVLHAGRSRGARLPRAQPRRRRPESTTCYPSRSMPISTVPTAAAPGRSLRPRSRRSRPPSGSTASRSTRPISRSPGAVGLRGRHAASLGESPPSFVMLAIPEQPQRRSPRARDRPGLPRWAPVRPRGAVRPARRAGDRQGRDRQPDPVVQGPRIAGRRRSRRRGPDRPDRPVVCASAGTPARHRLRGRALGIRPSSASRNANLARSLHAVARRRGDQAGDDFDAACEAADGTPPRRRPPRHRRRRSTHRGRRRRWRSS